MYVFIYAGANVCMHLCKLGGEDRVNIANPSSVGVCLYDRLSLAWTFQVGKNDWH